METGNNTLFTLVVQLQPQPELPEAGVMILIIIPGGVR